MGLFSKLKDLLHHKKKVSKQIAQINQQTVQIEQKKFDDGLKKSSGILEHSISEISKKYHVVNQDLIDDIESLLLSLDIGTSSTQKILSSIEEELKFQKVIDPDLIKQIITDKLFVYYIQDTSIDTDIKINKNEINVILVTGVNGVGKTTSIAKLANMYKKQGYKICLIAGDTFRAGAVQQLSIWAGRIGIYIHKPQKDGQDPASVIYSGLTYAKENKIDIVICDTSGRLQNKVNLMNELKKINNVIKKFEPNQPVESLLTIDATTGQSGINQAKAFNEVTKLTGIILTKMDGTSKGGIILSIKDAFNLPVKFIGFGEQLEDLHQFDLEMFINGLIKGLNINEK
ncbi:MAG: signal recognition particle-docking protein FtsY [Mycoplasmataceae bacterium]|nr:signal recognition particle-docking protein FtsY [Mycoplasmataceae bacterium]